MVDGIVFHRPRTVSACVMNLEPKTRVYLFARLHGIQYVMAVLYFAFAAFVEGILGVDQIAMVRQQPLDAIRVAGLFVCGERKNQVAIRQVVLLLETDEGCNPDGGHGLVIGRTAAPEETFSFEEFERIDRPVAPG